MREFLLVGVGGWVGFVGAFTTLSTYCLDALRLLKGGKPFFSLLYRVGSVVAGLGDAPAGVALARVLPG